MTTFKSSIQLCGLSQQGAAEYLCVSLSSIKDWCRGKTAPPMGAWIMMSDLYGRVTDAGERAAEKISPDKMDRKQICCVVADDVRDPLPCGSDSAAAAVAVMSSILNSDG